MSPDGRAVNRDHRPDDLAHRVRFALEGLEDPLPNALAAPAEQSVVAGLPLPIPFGHVPPGGAGAQHPEDALHHPPVIGVGAAGARLLRRQQRFELCPLLVGQFPLAHAARIPHRPPVCRCTLIPVHGSENPSRHGDVVFVHGLNGHPIRTWQREANEIAFWPRWLGADCPNLGI